jgi:hypothetical protein
MTKGGVYAIDKSTTLESASIMASATPFCFWAMQK